MKNLKNITNKIIIGFIVLCGLMAVAGYAGANGIDKEALKLSLHAENVELKRTVTIHLATYQALEGMISTKEAEVGTRIKQNSDYYNLLSDSDFKLE